MIEKTICKPVTSKVVILIDCSCFFGRSRIITIPSIGRNVKNESIGKLFIAMLPVLQTFYLEEKE